jgi:hypothetical protein
MIPQHRQPEPRKGTRVRIYGPDTVNGMRVWKVMDVTKEPWRQVGPVCPSYEEALERAKEVAEGKPVVWFGNRKLVPTPYY